MAAVVILCVFANVISLHFVVLASDVVINIDIGCRWESLFAAVGRGLDDWQFPRWLPCDAIPNTGIKSHVTWISALMPWRLAASVPGTNYAISG